MPLFILPYWHPAKEAGRNDVIACDPGAELAGRFFDELPHRLTRCGEAYIIYSNLSDTLLLSRMIRKIRFRWNILAIEEGDLVTRYLVRLRSRAQ